MLCERCFGLVNSSSYHCGDYLLRHPQLLAVLPNVTVRCSAGNGLWVWFHARCLAEELAGDGPGRPGPPAP